MHTGIVMITNINFYLADNITLNFFWCYMLFFGAKTLLYFLKYEYLLYLTN